MKTRYIKYKKSIKTIIKITFSYMLLLVAFNIKSSIYASISDDFLFVIDTIGVPRYNVYGEEINEEVYYTYNVFAYSNPVSISNLTSMQRFKEVPYYGKWTLGLSSYKGYGTRGEYYILGRDYSGSYIYNVYFPVDAIPETTPDKWEYIATKEAYDSWINISKYSYQEQIEYMKKTDMLFDELNYTENKANPYNLKSYGISAEKIGLDKAILVSPATWKTNGVIKVYRKNNLGQTRYAIFSTNPMAASADVLPILECPQNIEIGEYENEKKISIKFGTSAINLNNYANEKHIKEICSIIYINGEEYARVSGSKTVKVDKNINFTVTREEIKKEKEVIKIKVESFLYTEFYVDGVLKKSIEKEIVLKVNPPIINPLENTECKILKINKENKKVVSPLVHNLYTESYNSQGIIEAGRYLAVKIDLNKDIDPTKLSNIKSYINDVEIQNNIIYQNSNSIILEIKVDNEFKNTIKSWSYLRDITNNYFKIDFSEIGKRICEPNTLKLEVEYNGKSQEKTMLFDSIDSFSKNLNYIFDENVTNISEISEEILLEEWIKNE